jgi:hypothetical protein
MQHVSKIVVGIMDITRLKEQYAKIKRQVTFIETLLICNYLGKIARHFRERHGSLAVRHRRICGEADTDRLAAATALAALRCAIETSDQLRTPAGPDAIPSLERRRSMSEQAFLEKQRELIGLPKSA